MLQHDRRRHFGLTLLFAVGLLWPAMINGGPLLFFDSIAYVNQGEKAVTGLLAALAAPADSGGTSDDGFKAAAGSATYVRSLSWSGFAYLTAVATPRAWGPVLAQSLLVAALVMLFLLPATGLRIRVLCAALLVLGGFTSLPWFASYLMPDILAAVLILAGMLLVQETGGAPHRPLVLTLVAAAATFALASHAGFVPLGAAVAGAVLLVLIARRRLAPRLAVAAVLPLLIAVGANMAASKVAFDTPEVAPKRLPILLARSIEDGPAQWYLAKACPAAGYVICPHVVDMPTSIDAVLWGSDSLVAKLSDAEIERLRAEEPAILAATFRAYPVQQSWALIGNGVQQLWAIGTGDFRWGRATLGRDGQLRTRAFSEPGDRAGLDAVAQVQTLVVIASLLVIGAFAVRDRLSARRDERALLIVLLSGLVANAAIFGGLSAPVDRYQARVIWLVPLIAIVFGINRLRPGRPS